MMNPISSFLAALGPEVAVPLIVFAVPIIAILTSHQRKMAEIIHGSRAQANPMEIEALRMELAELRQLMHQQTIVLDNLANRPSVGAAVPPAAPNFVGQEIPQRLG